MAAIAPIVRQARAPGAVPNTSLAYAVFDFLLPSYFTRTPLPSSPSSAAGLTAHRRQSPSSTPDRHVGTAAAMFTKPHIQLESSQQRCHKSRRSGLVSFTFASASTKSSLQQRRHFSSTQISHNTHTILNPQLDESDNEMRLEITPRAAKRLSQVMKKDGNPHLALRIQVESGGCHGFQYLMSLVTLPETLHASAPTPPADSPAESSAEPELPAIREDDTIFAYISDDAEAANGTPNPLSAPKIILDTPSLELLNGSKVDFTMELIGSQFKIVDNPLATSSCGCGTSFDIKI